MPKLYTSFNRWFLIPFFIWMVFGGIALALFDRQTLFAIVNTHHTSTLDVAMVWITLMGEGVFGTLILLWLWALPAFRNAWYFSAAFLCNVIPALVVQILKSMVNEARPLVYFKGAQWIHFLPDWERLSQRSFPSGHTTAAFCLFTFLSFILPPKYKIWGLPFFILAMSVGYSRLYLAAHFFHDVYVGSLIGVLFTILVVWVMRRFEFRFTNTSNSEKQASL
ncbi:MAG: phosphatase PAP2 family protein [Bacteroidetes bacterium]|nr:phosphatase PAP2 family protein [Bacteroidota bacterium]